MSDRSAATTSSIFIEYAGKTISTYHTMTPITPKSIIIGVLLCASAVPTAIAADGFCTFYSEDRCEKRVGSVNYNTHNNGIFQNSGPYFKCAVDEEFSLISSRQWPSLCRPRHAQQAAPRVVSQILCTSSYTSTSSKLTTYCI